MSDALRYLVTSTAVSLPASAVSLAAGLIGCGEGRHDAVEPDFERESVMTNGFAGRLLLAAACLLATMATAQAGWDETVLHHFVLAGGGGPVASLVSDKAGNLYGTVLEGGPGSFGAVFELSPPAPGHTVWGSRTLHLFSGPDGANPTAGMILDTAGNLYGTTENGGRYSCGTVFELSPPGSGHAVWKYTVLHHFKGNVDGCYAIGGLVFDSTGNLYGTTGSGGGFGDGTVFELTRPADGHTIWQESILHAFIHTHGGAGPVGGVIFDAAGNLYGTTVFGGAFKSGVVFKLTAPLPHHTDWVETILHSFAVGNSGHPEAGVIFDSTGNLYGTTYGAGGTSGGTVFELSPPEAGQTAWTETTLVSFSDTGADSAFGAGPLGGVVFDPAGHLYGTTYEGGTHNDGTVFELTPPAAEKTAWTETVILDFNGGDEGRSPKAGMIFDTAGDLLGTTASGGEADNGTVFRLAPPS